MKSLKSFWKLSLGLFIVGIVASCNSDDTTTNTVTSTIQFQKNSLSIAEGQTGNVKLTLDKPSNKDREVTLQLANATAEYGVDFIIAKVIFPEQEFVVTIPKDSTTVTVPIYALGDFDSETNENFDLKIESYSDGIHSGDVTSVNVTITNVVNLSEENRAISFDGVDDYIDLGNIFDDLELPFSVSAWVWIDPSVSDGVLLPVFISQDGSDVYNGFSFNTSTLSHVGLTYGDGLGGNSSVYRRSKGSDYYSPTRGRWVNITAVVRGAVDMSLYLNGVEIPGEYNGSSNSPMDSNASTKNAVIGLMHGNGSAIYRFVGLIDEVKVWNRELSEAEVQVSIFNKSVSTENGLIGYWDFDEPDGTTVYDKSSNQFNGVIQNKATRVISNAPVK
ncbi:MAG TPA: LamG domain-containing protein [Cyclobacteriaceae bacterium]